MKEPDKRSISKQDKKDLKVLANDFCILNENANPPAMRDCVLMAAGNDKEDFANKEFLIMG